MFATYYLIFTIPVFVLCDTNCDPCKCIGEKDVIADCTKIPPTELYTIEKILKELKNPLISEINIQFVTKKVVLQNNMFYDENIYAVRSLKIRNCALQSIETDALKNLTNLQTLNVNFNDIIYLSTGMFDHCPKLTQLFLNNNRIKFIPVGLFDKLSNLNVLKLHSNNLTELNVDTFKNNLYLQVLDISDNKFTYLNSTIFQNISKHIKLFIQDNPWNCSCPLYDLYKLVLPNAESFSLGQTFCQNGKKWTNLNKDDFMCDPTIQLNIFKIEANIIFECYVTDNSNIQSIQLLEIINGRAKHTTLTRTTNKFEHSLRLSLNTSNINDISCLVQRNNKCFYQNMTKAQLQQHIFNAQKNVETANRFRPKISETTKKKHQKYQQNIAAKEGDTINLKCASNINWFYKDFQIDQNVIIKSNGKYSLQNKYLQIVNITQQEVGLYKCMNSTFEKKFNVMIETHIPTLIIVLIIVFVVLLLLIIITIYYFKKKMNKSITIPLQRFVNTNSTNDYTKNEAMVESNIYISSDNNIYEAIQ